MTSPFGAGVRLVIFDADGTLRTTTVPGQPCPHAPNEWTLLPCVRDVLGAVDWAGERIRVGVASNQDHVGYGIIDHETARRLLYDALFAATSGKVADPAIRFCPHLATDGCDCRKPAPGMLLSIMRECGAAPHETVFVGNDPVDVQAAERAGVRFIHARELFLP